MGVVSTVLCLDLRIGAGTGTGRFSCSGSLKPALRGTDLRFFAGNKAARSLFRGGVRRCITVGISDEIPVLPSRLDFRGGGCLRAANCGDGQRWREANGERRVANDKRRANSRHRQQATNHGQQAANSKQRATDCGGGRRVGGEQQTANSGQEKAGDRRCAADFLQGREGCGDRASEIAEFNVSLYHAAEKRTI